MATTALPVAPFYVYEGPAFPSPDALLACRGVKRLAPFGEPMAQFYAELALSRQLLAHPARVRDAAAAELFFVPIMPHLDADAGNCNGTTHRSRMSAVASALRMSPQWQRSNGTDHFWGCTCVMMRPMLTAELWALLATAMHAVHSVPRMKASPSSCQLTIPYLNPSFAATDEAPTWRRPGRPRPLLMHFRGRVMNRVRSSLVRTYGKATQPRHIVHAEHAATAARCNLNKCSQKKMAAVGFSATRHFEEMKGSLFCLVPVGDSPPSSRLYLAVAAGCIPVLISDQFEGAFPTAVPWRTFSLRVPEADVEPGRAKRRAAAMGGEAPRRPFNLTATLQAIADDAPRLRAMQLALEAHAVDVLWEAPGSRAGGHALSLATLAVRRVCPHGGGAVAGGGGGGGGAGAGATMTASANLPAELHEPRQVRFDLPVPKKL